MIEKIFIPTVKRTNLQLTYENLPSELKSRVVFVIDPNEKHLYNYPVEYLEIPKEFIGSWTQLAKTRKFIHQQAKNIKYAMFDDDLIFIKRNKKYFSMESDIENSKRKATPDEIFRMFNTASKILDDEKIGIVGTADPVNPPERNEFIKTKGVFCAYFIDGKKISKIVDILDTSIRIGEDLLFLFDCLSNGIDVMVMNEFLYENKSTTKLFKDNNYVWENIEDAFQSKEHIEAMKYIHKKYPHGIDITLKNGKYKFKKHWKSVYKQSISDNTLLNFYDKS